MLTFIILSRPHRCSFSTTWRIPLNHLCAAVIRPYVKLLWPLVIITTTTTTIYIICHHNFKVVLDITKKQEGQHKLTAQRAASFNFSICSFHACICFMICNGSEFAVFRYM